MDVIEIISTTLGVAWASGINLYAVVFMLGILDTLGMYDLPAGLEILSNPLVIGAAGLMYGVEFFADKIPGVDTLWDAIHSFIRIPAGAMLAAGAISPMGAEAEFAGLLLGGTLSAGSHFTKAGSRVLINSSPEPFSNWAASISEDVLVVGGMWAALNHPVLFIIMLILLILLAIWVTPKIWRGVKIIFGKIRGFFTDAPSQEALEPSGGGVSSRPSISHDASHRASDASGDSKDGS